MTTLTNNPAAGKRNLTPAELQAALAAGGSVQLVDVREHPEFAAGRIAGSRLLPLSELERRAAELDRSLPVMCVCRSGKRSAQAAEKLATMGFAKVQHLDGGLTAWDQAELPLERDAYAPWALERQVRFAAGLLVLAGLGCSLIWPLTIGLAWFVSAGLVFTAIIDWCGMGLLLAKMPWNRLRQNCAGSCKA